MRDVVVRPGTAGDLAAVTAIYNHYVETSNATFDTASFTPEQRRPWLEAHAATGPHRLFVAEQEDEVVGYAASGPVRPKPAYDEAVEVTVYVAPEAVGTGVGDTLYRRLLPELDAAGVHRAYAAVALPNPASEALHRRHGFERVGTWSEAGFKLGSYWDLAWYERRAGVSRRRRSGR